VTQPVEHAADRESDGAAHGDGDQRERIQRLLLAWYASHGRDLPWRHTRDPYAVLVSEVMLQQTQVDRVLPKYHEFLARFPTLAALGAAPIADVIRAWSPLGYNVRAVRLHAIARQAVADFDGALPGTLAGLLALKGIGRYTAGAIACFAFGLPVATVDTNIRRTLWRVFRGIEPAPWPAGQAATRAALELAEWALPADHAYAWQQALMDLGATLCTSRRPVCERCPLAGDCAALAEVGRTTLFASGDALTRLRDVRAAEAIAPAASTARRVAETAGDYTALPGTTAGSSRQAVMPEGKRAPRKGQAAVPFTSSSRYFRGRVLAALRALTAGETLSLRELGPQIKPDWTPSDLAWLRGIVLGLARDGLVCIEPAAEADASDGATRVALP
jgi:A/G-specific adenine glycosylase